MKKCIYIKHQQDYYDEFGRINDVLVEGLGYSRDSFNRECTVIRYQKGEKIVEVIPFFVRFKEDLTELILSNVSDEEVTDLSSLLRKEDLKIKGMKEIE